MSKNKKVWIPAIFTVAAAILLLVYYFLTPHPRIREHEHPMEGIVKTLGTISLYMGAVSFSWYWFKRKRKSPSQLLRKVGKMLHAIHQPLGWATLLFIAVHGAYFLIIKPHDHKIMSGIANFLLLLTLAGYGYFILRIRNKWMRTVHRMLAIAWVPILFFHAGGSVIAATAATLAAGGLAWLVERSAILQADVGGKDK
nr:hypothetical protein [Paenibacillus sp. HB172176]